MMLEGTMAGNARILVLGPVEIECDGRLSPVGGPRARTVLAVLAIGLGHAVSYDRIMDAVWGAHPPPTARSAVQSHISRLRHHLGHDAIQRHDHSYLLDVDPEQVDACAFERLYKRAAAALDEEPAAATELCRRALDLWRGPAFGELGGEDFARPEAVRLEELRVDAMELYLEATIAGDDPGLAVPSLRAAAADHPYREKLWYLLMRALAVEGRRVEALRAYQEARLTLAEAGLEPAMDLRELEEQIYTEADKVRSHLSD
jgi:DNA-binding SARP family transcriptional activator